MAKQKPPRCSNKWASSAQHWLQQQGAGDLTLPLVLNEHDGTTNSNAVSVIVENFNAAAAANVENFPHFAAGSPEFRNIGTNNHLRPKMSYKARLCWP